MTDWMNEYTGCFPDNGRRIDTVAAKRMIANAKAANVQFPDLWMQVEGYLRYACGSTPFQVGEFKAAVAELWCSAK